MENLLLPRRERLFNNGGKLHFQNFSALFQGVLSKSFPSGKYHCKAKSLSKTISRLRHIIAKGNKVNPYGRLPRYACNDIVLRTQNNICSDYPPLKSQNFDAIKPHKYTVSCGSPVTFLGKFLRRGENFIIIYKY